MTTQQVFEKASAALSQAEGSLRFPVQEDKVNKALKKLELAKSGFSIHSDLDNSKVSKSFEMSIGHLREVVFEIQKGRRMKGMAQYSVPGPQTLANEVASIALQSLLGVRKVLNDWYEIQEEENE